ncbi:hypothetical protein TWF730_000131 [Orbilia blumenaviensis]|uniref:F-box domain-containing protein n=1 Tax=Orbilia blumenaviensis TaxID=1796055 RepID=A0AAV9VM01_9PEZI
MSIETLPTEILIQILDDVSLQVGDLAVISRVSRRWHSAVIPVLYKRFTFRYYHPLTGEDQSKLESFRKHGRHVKYLNLHIKRWEESEQPQPPVSNVALYLGILDAFTEVTHVEHYDIEIYGLHWPIFWTILNYLVSEKQELISLTIRRNPSRDINTTSDQDIDPKTLLPTPCLPNLAHFNLRVNCKGTGWPDTIESVPIFHENLALALGESCRNVSNFQFYTKLFDTAEVEKIATFQGIDLPRLPMDNIKELRYEVLPVAIPPTRLLDTNFGATKVLTTSSWVCGYWLHQAWEQLPSGESLGHFQNLEVLRITDAFKIAKDGNLETNLKLVTQHLPKLETLILEYDERQFSISRKLDGTLIWEEVAFIV